MTFYSEDVYLVWQKWTEQGVEPLRQGIEISLDDSQHPPNGPAESDAQVLSGIKSINVGYTPLKQHLEKSRSVLAAAPLCTVCAARLPPDGAMTLVCSHTTCHTAGHLSCLAPLFSCQGEDLVPTSGKCPGCGTKQRWIDLVKELSVRMRGEAEVQKLFKVRKARGKKQDEPAAAATGIEDDASEDDGVVEDDVPYLTLSDESEIDDVAPSTKAFTTSAARGFHAADTSYGADPIIEDSEWDDAEIIT